MLSLSVVTPGTPKKPNSNSDSKEQSTPKLIKSKESNNEEFKTPDNLSFIVNNEKKLSNSKLKDTIDGSMLSTRSVKIETLLQKESDKNVESSFTKSIRRLSNPISVKRLSLIVANNNNPKSEPLIKNNNDLEKKEMTKAIEKMNELKKEIQIDEHRLSFSELSKRFKTDLENGLSDTMASDLLIQNGPNSLTPPKTIPEWLKLLKTMNSGFSLLLWLGATFSFIAFFSQYAQDPGTPLDNVCLGMALICVVILTGCFQYYQESKSTKIMETFKKMIPLQAIAIREGKKINIPVEELVVGDVVQIKSGDRIPADIRIIKSEGLKVDNSCLTGESEAQSRTPDCTDNNPLETKNLIFFSTYAVEGNATGLVIRTGDYTAVGRIANLAANLEERETHLAKEIKHFVRIITIVAFLFGISFFIISLSLRNRVLDSIVFLIGVVVANVPEGLLACVTVCLALTAKRMAKKNCLVKHLEAVEALGSVGIICSDKTGTLTMNQMTVSHMWFDGKIVRVNMNNKGAHVYENFTFLNEEQRTMSFSRDTDFNPHESVTWKKLMRSSILCNRSEFRSDLENMAKEICKRSCTSDASEIALLKYSETVIGDVLNYRQENPKLFEIPFNSTNKYQLSVHETKENSNKGRLLVMKGAPERILEHCDTVLMNGVEQKITKEFRKQFEEAYETLGGLGERVLGFCDYRIDYEKCSKEFKFDENNTPINGLRLLGLISMIDPPKPNVSEAVAKCRSAGIRVFMVTGDHPITAKAIAKSVGIITEETREDVATRLNIPIEHVDPQDVKAIVVHGAQLAEMNTVELDRILRRHKEIVFARTSPQQKLLIVEGCQRLDVLVGVTGDGVNDSPAMKKADIGISMGITGSDVSKQVADMILLDDNFATIVNGIEEGRLIFENISKIVSYTFTKNMTELTPFIMYVLLNMPLALGTITILCVDLGTDILPSLSLSYEYAERGIMSLPPRDPFKDKMTNSKMVSFCYGQIGLIEAAGGFFAYSVCLAESGFLPSRLIGIRTYWDSSDINDLQDSFGGEWTYNQRKILEQAAQTSFFIGVVVSQVANILMHKTKRVSLFRHGIRNMHLNFAIFATLCLAAFLIYTPGLNTGLGLFPIKPLWWLPAIPFAVFLLLFSELKKYITNKYPGSFIDKEFNS